MAFFAFQPLLSETLRYLPLVMNDLDILINPKRGKGEKTIPSQGLFLVNPAEARFAMKMVLEAGGKRRFLFHSELVVSKDAVFFVAGPAVGAPMAVMTLEKLIVLGAVNVLMFGWCGAIQAYWKIGDLVSGGRAYCGEGASRYYTSETVCRPSSRFLEVLQNSSLGLPSPQAIWSTDAVYRESKKMLKALADKYNIYGIDMEYSALCAVAAFRGIEFGAIFLVSDELWHKEWRAGFAGKALRKRSREQVEILLKYYSSPVGKL